jgi:hypothetical protein
MFRMNFLNIDLLSSYMQQLVLYLPLSSPYNTLAIEYFGNNYVFTKFLYHGPSALVALGLPIIEVSRSH